MALVGVLFGVMLLVLAFVSTISKVTLSIFNPWLGRQIRFRNRPRTFVAVVFFYWLTGAAGVIIAIMGLLSAE